MVALEFDGFNLLHVHSMEHRHLFTAGRLREGDLILFSTVLVLTGGIWSIMLCGSKKLELALWSTASATSWTTDCQGNFCHLWGGLRWGSYLPQTLNMSSGSLISLWIGWGTLVELSAHIVACVWLDNSKFHREEPLDQVIQVPYQGFMVSLLGDSHLHRVISAPLVR